VDFAFPQPAEYLGHLDPESLRHVLGAYRSVSAHGAWISLAIDRKEDGNLSPLQPDFGSALYLRTFLLPHLSNLDEESCFSGPVAANLRLPQFVHRGPAP
jgi:hypothetical protein